MTSTSFNIPQLYKSNIIIFKMAFSKFKDHSKKNKPVVRTPGTGSGPGGHAGGEGTDAPVRVKMPRGREVIGVISQRLGGSRMFISCMDGKTRNCKVPGRLRRDMWLREGDVVIVEPWEFDDEKGEILFKYSFAAIERLKNMGLLKTSASEF